MKRPKRKHLNSLAMNYPKLTITTILVLNFLFAGSRAFAQDARDRSSACPNQSVLGAYHCFPSDKTIDLLTCKDELACPDSNQRCCIMPAVGESGNRCLNKEEIKKKQEDKELLNNLNNVFGKKTGCKWGWFDIPCPVDIIEPVIQSATDLTKKSLGLGSIGNSLLACTTGKAIPDAIDMQTGDIADFDKCMCVNEKASPVNAVMGLCIKHLGGVPPAFGRTSLAGSAWNGILTRSVLNLGDRWISSGRASNILIAVPSAFAYAPYQVGNFILTFKETKKQVEADMTGEAWTAMISTLGTEGQWKGKTDAEKDQGRTEFIGCASCALAGGYPSAIGCLPLDNVGLFISQTVFGILMGFAGAFCIGCFIYSSVTIQFSQGDSEQIANARKTLTQCILGFLFIIFAVFILRFVGVNLLQIYGLS